MDKPVNVPLPVQLLEPWVEDNQQFVEALKQRDAALASVRSLRDKLTIRKAQPAARCLLDAVDAAQFQVEFGDQLTILVQGARVHDDGATDFPSPRRATGINGYEFSLAAMPMRIAEEFSLLATSTTPTIADLSYWTALLDFNHAALRRTDIPHNAAIVGAVKTLIDDRVFIAMIENPCVIPMTKTSQSDTLLPGVSDRHVLTMILDEDEYIAPRSLSTTGAGFRIERHALTAVEVKILDDYYQHRLGVIFYKPYAWSRAYRIEAHINKLKDDAWLMPLLAAIKHHTIERMIQEPWPQFMVDYTVRQISGVAPLYGELNWHRYPQANYIASRTRISRKF